MYVNDVSFNGRIFKNFIKEYIWLDIVKKNQWSALITRDIKYYVLFVIFVKPYSI